MHYSQGTVESPESTEHARSRIGRTVIAGSTITVGVLQRIFDAAPWRVVILSVVVMAWSLSVLTQQSCGRVVVSVAAGGKDGESYKMLSAVSRLIQRRHPNVTIKVLATKGTEENLRRLNGGGVELATAQADVALDAWLTRSAATKDAGSGGLMAVLFVDKVQLLACGLPQKGAPFSAQQAFAALAERKTKAVVYLPYEAGGPSGGQYRTFLHLAEHYGLLPHRDFEFRNAEGEVPRCTDRERFNLVFRVRADGNAGVQRALDSGWRLVALQNTGSMRLTSRALVRSEVLAGTYRVKRPGRPSLPEPTRDIDTVAVRRLLLAREGSGMPGWLVRDITRVLIEQGPKLARTATGAADAMDGVFLGVRALNTRPAIAEVGLPLHTDVAVYYNPGLSWFAWLNSNGDGLGFVLGLLGILASGLEAARRWVARWFVSSRKDLADRLVNEATRLMKPMEQVQVSVGEAGEGSLGLRVQALSDHMEAKFDIMTIVSSDTLAAVEKISELTRVRVVLECVYQLVDAQGRLKVLEHLFADAGAALDAEEISEESFRTVNQAIRVAKGAIEAEIEGSRRQISLYFVQRLMRLVPDRGGSGPMFGGDGTDVYPEDILHDALPVLTNPLVFSRESFRTFTDAYHLARPHPPGGTEPVAPAEGGAA